MDSISTSVPPTGGMLGSEVSTVGIVAVEAKSPSFGDDPVATGWEVETLFGAAISSVGENIVVKAGVEDLEGTGDIYRSRSTNEDLVLRVLEYRPGGGIDPISTSDVPNCESYRIPSKIPSTSIKVDDLLEHSRTCIWFCVLPGSVAT